MENKSDIMFYTLKLKLYFLVVVVVVVVVVGGTCLRRIFYILKSTWLFDFKIKVEFVNYMLYFDRKVLKYLIRYWRLSLMSTESIRTFLLTSNINPLFLCRRRKWRPKLLHPYLILIRAYHFSRIMKDMVII